jgi:hypothetical protein
MTIEDAFRFIDDEFMKELDKRKELLDKISELQNDNEVKRWISCKERMPDKDEFVLCYCRANITVVLYWNGYNWYSADSYNGYLSGFVTHWMPLPEPPEKE